MLSSSSSKRRAFELTSLANDCALEENYDEMLLPLSKWRESVHNWFMFT